jgi:hypothetical protein
MNPATFLDARFTQLQPQTERLILIAGGLQDFIAQSLREEIGHCGWDCEIFQTDISDCAQLGNVIREALNRFHPGIGPVNDPAGTSDRLVRKMTDEEWLAQ